MPLLYELLGVDADATTPQVRAGFKRRAVQLHPDKGGDPDDFAALREAYDTLADPQRRAEYDRQAAAGEDGLAGEGRAARGNAEMDMLRRFREAEEYASRDPTVLHGDKPKSAEGFGGGGIAAELERLRGAAPAAEAAAGAPAAPAPAGGALARATTPGAGFGGGPACDVRLPALATEALVFRSHGAAAEVCEAEGAWALGRVLRYGEVRPRSCSQ